MKPSSQEKAIEQDVQVPRDDKDDKKDLFAERTTRQRLEEIIEIAGSVCHELNQPMQSVSGYSELLLMRMTEDNPYYKEIKSINQQVERMAEITKNLIRLTRIDSDKYIGADRVFDAKRVSDPERARLSNQP